MAVVRSRVIEPLLDLLRQGVTPEKLALSLALGAAVGVFPLLGTTTLLAIAAGVVLRLNHPALQLANWLMYPLQVPLLLVFVRLGERLTGSSPLLLSPALLAGFRQDPAAFVERFGAAGVHALAGWALVAPAAVAVIYAAALPVLRRTVRTLPRA